MRARALAFLLYPVAGVGLASIFRWTDAPGRELPTRSCPRCQRVIPVHRWSAPAGGIRHRPSEVLSCVEWCGHQQEMTLVPEGPRVG